MVALMLEYDPAPPVHTGTPRAAGTNLTDTVRDMDMVKDWLQETESFAMAYRRGCRLRNEIDISLSANFNSSFLCMPSAHHHSFGNCRNFQLA